jgi:phosphatidylcholine synthase
VQSGLTCRDPRSTPIAGHASHATEDGEWHGDSAPVAADVPRTGRRDWPAVSSPRRVAAYLVHVYTASGVLFALLATVELCRQTPDPRRVFAWLVVALFIDSTDGVLARRARVKERTPAIDGRKIDDLVDYLTFTFVPLLLVWRMGWLPGASAGTETSLWSLVWIAPALVASLFGFANLGAKDEGQGLFLGFPSYWNLYAYYAGFWSTHGAAWLSAALLVLFTALTLLPVRFAYPNLAPRPWRLPLLVGGGLWAVVLVGLLPWYPDVPEWVLWTSLVYPAFYVGVSVWLDVRTPRG